jgi:NADPH-dependent curcumin reductase CurA
VSVCGKLTLLLIHSFITFFWKAASVGGFLMPHYKEYIPVARDRLLNLFYTGKLQLPIYSTQFNGIESIPAGNNCDKVVVNF